MSELLAHNLEFVEKYNPVAAGRIRTSSSVGITPVEARDGMFVPRVSVGGKNLFVHSRFDPVTEAKRFLSEVSGGGHTLFVVAGFGYGYHCEALLDQMGKDATLLILEKSGAIVRSALENRDLSRLFGDPRVVLLMDPTEDEIAGRMRGRSSRSAAFIAHRGSCQVDGEYYPNILRIAKSYVSTKDVNIATLAKFEKLWSSNIARNTPLFLATPPVNAFFGGFDGIPAIVVAAGPSLTESIPFIRRSIGHAVVIAVDTSYFILRRHGISPHLCVSVDPQVINARYFEGDTGGDTILVADPCAHPSALRMFRGRKLMAGVPFEMMKWIEMISGDKGDLAHGGSVSTNAYDLAKRLGCSPIVLVGQDLAFTGGLAHARGSYLDEQSHLKVTRLWNEQMMNRSQLSALPKIMVRSIDGKKIHTNQKMMIFLNWFEKLGDPDIVNATRNGSFMNGIAHRRDADIDLIQSGDIRGTIDRLYASAVISSGLVDLLHKKTAEQVSVMIEGAEKLREKLERAVVLSDELCAIMEKSTRDSGKVGYILGKLSDIDKQLESLGTVKDMVGLTVQRVIHTITEGYDADADGAVSQEHAVALRSRYLYRGLEEGCGFSLKILTRMRDLLCAGL